MRYLLPSLLIFVMVDHLVAVEPALPPAVVSAVVYRDSVISRYAEEKNNNKINHIILRKLDDNLVKITVNLPRSKTNLGPVFVRNGILVYGVNCYEEVQLLTFSYDYIHFILADQLYNAKMIFVDPNGDPVELTTVLAGRPSVWWRDRQALIGATEEIRHSALAPVGERDVLLFDLFRTVPAKGMPATPHRLAVKRIFPDRMMPKEKLVEEIPAEFTVPFQAYLIGDDYYFVTNTGVVYRSPPPQKGQPRTMTAVWDQSKKPVRFLISDGNRAGVHFLITPGEKGGWDYCRLGPDPRPEALRSGTNDPDPLEMIFEFALKLREKKAIVTPK